MADGYRILESGDLRISEAGDVRTTEQFYTASASLVSSSASASSATLTLAGVTSLSNVGSVLFAGYANRPAAARLESTSTVSPDADLRALGVTALVSSSTQDAVGLRIRPAEAQLASEGTLATQAGFKVSGQFSGVATATLDNIGGFTAYATFDTDQDNVVRLTESGDIRVTEDGLDTRVSLNVNPNAVYGNIVSDGTHIIFSATAYIKEDGVWKEFDPYVKFNGQWAFPDKVYKNISDSWKRVY